jgi:tRNA-dihydrouridine synthase
VGTAAFRDPAYLADLVAAYGDRVAVTIDVADGKVRVAGWREGVELDVATAMSYCLEAGVTRVMGTAIDRDGTMAGPDLALYRQLCDSPLRVLAAGGVRDDADVRELERVGCEGAIMGRAYLSRLASWREAPHFAGAATRDKPVATGPNRSSPLSHDSRAARISSQLRATKFHHIRTGCATADRPRATRELGRSECDAVATGSEVERLTFANDDAVDLDLSVRHDEGVFAVGLQRHLALASQ